jgi:hypothetical protein
LYSNGFKRKKKEAAMLASRLTNYFSLRPPTSLMVSFAETRKFERKEKSTES